MKTNHKIDSRKIEYNKYLLALIFLLLASTILSGCGTAHFVREGIGRKAKIKFEVLNPQMPNPMIHWVEYPNPSETALTLNPSLPGCDKLRFFVNPTKSDAHELSDKFEEVDLIKLRTEKDEQNLWNFVPSDHCAVLLTVGYGDFVGLSASTRSGVFERHEISFQKDMEGNPFYLITAAAAPFYDAWYTPSYLVLGLAAAAIPAIDDLTVVLDFPDGRRNEIKLTYDEASAILKDHFSNSDFVEFGILPSRFVNFWLHAALVKLRIDFTVKGSKTNPDSPFLQAYIESIDRFEGSWRYQVDDSPVAFDLIEGPALKSGSVIRFYQRSH